MMPDIMFDRQSTKALNFFSIVTVVINKGNIFDLNIRSRSAMMRDHHINFKSACLGSSLSRYVFLVAGKFSNTPGWTW